MLSVFNNSTQVRQLHNSILWITTKPTLPNYTTTQPQYSKSAITQIYQLYSIPNPIFLLLQQPNPSALCFQQLNPSLPTPWLKSANNNPTQFFKLYNNPTQVL